MAAIDEGQVKEAVERFRQVLSRYPQTMRKRLIEKEMGKKGLDIITTARLDIDRIERTNVRQCTKCTGRSRKMLKNGWKKVYSKRNLVSEIFDRAVSVLGPPEWTWAKYERRCICGGLWVALPSKEERFGSED